MKNFLKQLCIVILGNLVVGIVMAALAFSLFIMVFVAMGTKPSTPVPENSFLVLDLSMSLTDTPDQNNGALGGLLGKGVPQAGLWELTRALEAASTDGKIRGLFITGDFVKEGYGSGFAALGELRRAVLDFKKSGKPVLAYLDTPSLPGYYVASAADEICANPFAILPLRGLSLKNLYLGNALRQYGIGVQTTKSGKYKSAIEPFTSDKMSEADREQTQMLLDDLWGEICTDIATSRKLPGETLQNLANTHGLFDAQTALNAKLVDKTAYLDEVIEHIKSAGTASNEHHSFAQVNIRDYILTLSPPAKSTKTAIAILYAEGEIVDGHDATGKNAVAGDTLAARLRALRQDASIAAIVLRINSPGGSAFASETIQREVRRITATRAKPLVVSMGTYAASGGYWIATHADTILAEKTTITGSIGVFGIMFNLQEIATRAGIHFDGVKTARFADMETLSRPKTNDELELLQRLTDHIYEAFLDKVAEGRKLPRANVETLAQGRVWSGLAAQRHGLVDEIGGLREAIHKAAHLAKLAPHSFTILQYPEQRSALESLGEALTSNGENPVVKTRGLAAQMTRQWEHLRHHLEKMNDRHNIYARLPNWEIAPAP
jgi:protease-4